MSNNDVILQVNDLHTYFFNRRGITKAVDGISFSLRQGETLGIVGESGCGKTMTALSLLGLIPQPGARIVSGEIILDGPVDFKWIKLNKKKVICASTGNTSASVSAYSARAGLKSIVVIPSGKIAQGKLIQAKIYNSKIYRILGQ